MKDPGLGIRMPAASRTAGGDDGAPLTAVIRLLAESLPPCQLAERLTELVRTCFNVDTSYLWLRDNVTDPFRLVAGAGGQIDKTPPLSTSFQQFLEWIGKQPAAVALSDVRAEARSAVFAETGEGEVSFLAAPLQDDAGTTGILGLGTRSARVFSPREIDRCRDLATLVRIGFAAGPAPESLHRTEFKEILRLAGSARDVREILREVCRRTARLCSADRGTVYLWDGKTSRTVAAMSQLASDQKREDLWLRFKKLEDVPLHQIPLLQSLFDKAQPVVLDDVRRPGGLPSWVADGFQIKSLLAVPLLVEGEVMGTLIVDTMEEHRHFESQDVDLALAVADQVGFVLQKTRLHLETANRLHHAEANLKIARTLSSTLELKPLLRAITRQAARACDMDCCSIYLLEAAQEDSDRVTPDRVTPDRVTPEAPPGAAADPVLLNRIVPLMSQYADGRVDGKLGQRFRELGLRRVEEVPLFAQMLRTRQPIIVEQAAKDQQGPALASVFGSNTVLAVPLIIQEQVVGGMLLSNSGRNPPVEPAQVTLATTIASQVALAIDNARLHEETRRRLRETGALLSLARTIGSSLDRTEIARRTARELSVLLDADASVFYEVDEALASAVVVAGYRLPRQILALNPRLPLAERGSFILEGIRLGRPVASSDVANDPRFDHPTIRALPQPRSLLWAPVLSEGRELGGLVSFWWQESHTFSHEEIRLAEGIANQMALVLVNAHHYEQAQQALSDLETAQDRLIQSAKFRALAEMAAGVAHDFNNVLTAVLGQAQLLRYRWTGRELSDEAAQASLDIIETTTLDGAATVKRLLDFTRSKPRPDATERLDPNALLVHTREIARPRCQSEARSKGIQIEVVVLTGEVSVVTGNAAELREVLLNLAFNAIDAMPGGGTLTLESGAEDGRTWLRVRDTGIGMPDEVQQRIFEPFFTTKGEGSSGLGLSASYGIIQRHGGQIEVDSEPGRGTAFTIRLPLVGDPPR